MMIPTYSLIWCCHFLLLPRFCFGLINFATAWQWWCFDPCLTVSKKLQADIHKIWGMVRLWTTEVFTKFWNHTFALLDSGKMQTCVVRACAKTWIAVAQYNWSKNEEQGYKRWEKNAPAKRPYEKQNLQQQQSFYGPLSGTTRVSRYQKKHSPTHHPDHHPVFTIFFHLPRSIASSLFKLCAWQSFSTTSLHVLFGLPLGLEPSTSYSIYFFTQSVSRNTRPYHHNLENRSYMEVKREAQDRAGWRVKMSWTSS